MYTAVESGIIPQHFSTVNAVSGIQVEGDLLKSIRMHHRLMGKLLIHGIYGLNFSHKHVEEMHIPA